MLVVVIVVRLTVTYNEDIINEVSLFFLNYLGYHGDGELMKSRFVSVAK